MVTWHRYGGGYSVGHDLLRTVMHAAVWRVLWTLPLSVVGPLGIAAVLLLGLGARRVATRAGTFLRKVRP